MIGKWFGWKKYKLTPEEIEASKQALANAEQIERHAINMRAESARLGSSLRGIQRENHFGQSLTHAYRKA